jgi:hypothetical protein
VELLDHLRAVLAEGAAEIAAYRDSWGDKYGVDRLRKAWLCEDAPQRITVADLIGIPDEKLLVLGFRTWDGALRLVPLWAFGLLAPGEKLIAIDGDIGTVGATTPEGLPEIDLDTRFGCIAYGFAKPGAVPQDE